MLKRDRYDALRKRIPHIQKPNMLAVTASIDALPDKMQILKQVKDFNTFTVGNDPYHEHDFGSIDTEHGKVFWKIDDYGGQEGLELVLTVMLAEEY